MSFTNWLRNLRSAVGLDPFEGTHRRLRSLWATTHRLGLEVLEDRCLPSTFTVLNLLDSGPDSLRAAVVAANANPGADTIDFATAGTIALTSGQLDITDRLTINGPGAGALTVSGESVSRVFGIAGDPTVVIAGLTVADGWTTDSPGGGISMTGGTLTLDHVTVSGNYAVGAPGGYDYWYNVYSAGDGMGGGLYVAGGTLTLDQSIVSGNYAIGGFGLGDGGFGVGDGGRAAGAGLFVAGGTVYVNQSTVAGNQALGGAGGDIPSGYFDGDPYAGAGGAAAGGGIRIAAGTVAFYQSTLADNMAVGGGSGAGSWAYSGSPGAGEGGGLDLAGGTVTLDQSTVSGNSAVGGAGAVEPTGWYYNFGSYGARADGGGLYIAGTVNVSQSTVSGNRALGGAGGTAVNGLAYGVNGGDAAGGGMRVAAGTVQLSQSTLSGNTADGGSGGSGDFSGPDGVGVGGGLDIERAVPPLADLDIFTESNTVNNVADYDPNISGLYSLNGTPVLVISDVSILEGNSGTTAFVFTVSLSAPSSQTVSVDYATADGSATAGSDYQAASGTLTIPAGQTSGTITVLVNGDRLAEPNETFFVNLSAPTNATIADGTGAGTIVDDEPRIGISDVSKAEGNTGTTQFAFTVSLSAAYDAPVTVSFATADGTATAGSDYAASSGTLTFAPGQTSKTVMVQVIGDRLPEANETFVVNLSGPTNAVIADGQGVGTIVDDEPRISISDVTKTEGKKGHTTLFIFTVTLSTAYDQAVTLSYRTVDGTATTSDKDYVAQTGTITFNPGETSKTITIVVNGDNKKEADETFYLDLFGNSSNALFTKNRGVGTILNDD